jgi:hypothetical protein
MNASPVTDRAGLTPLIFGSSLDELTEIRFRNCGGQAARDRAHEIPKREQPSADAAA